MGKSFQAGGRAAGDAYYIGFRTLRFKGRKYLVFKRDSAVVDVFGEKSNPLLILSLSKDDCSAGACGHPSIRLRQGFGGRVMQHWSTEALAKADRLRMRSVFSSG
jgi:hypothetical protein